MTGAGKNPDLTVMRLNDAADDGEAKAGAFGLGRGEQCFERALLLFLAHAAAGVLERHRNVPGTQRGSFDGE